MIRGDSASMSAIFISHSSADNEQAAELKATPRRVFTTDNGTETFTWPDGGNTPFKGQKEVVEKVLYLRQKYHLGPIRIAAAEFGDAVLAAKTLQHDTDLLFRRKMPTRRAAMCPSRPVPPVFRARAPARPGTGTRRHRRGRTAL